MSRIVVSSTCVSMGVGGIAVASASRIAVMSSAVGRSSGVRRPSAMIFSTISSCAALGTRGSLPCDDASPIAVRPKDLDGLGTIRYA